VLWEVGIVGMFAFSMPYGETDMLACAERYMMTGLVYMFGLMVLSVVESINAWPPMSNIPPKFAAAGLAIIGAKVPLPYSGFPGQWGAGLYRIEARDYFAALKKKYPIDFGDAGMYVTDYGNQYYQLNKYIQTDFQATTVFPFSTTDAQSPVDLIPVIIEYAPEYDFLLIDTTNEAVLDGLADAMDKGAFYHMKVFLGMDAVLQ